MSQDSSKPTPETRTEITPAVETAPRQAPSPDTLAAELLASSSQVLAVLEAELPLLRAMRTEEIARLASDKVAATAGYQSLLQKLRGAPDLAGHFSATQRAALRQAALRLAEATADNARALRAGLEANHRLVRVIAGAVDEQQRGGPAYRPSGQNRGGGFKQPPPAVSVNRVL